MADRTEYIVKLRPEKGVDATAALRALLKRALRSHGMRAIEVRPVERESDERKPEPGNNHE